VDTPQTRVPGGPSSTITIDNELDDLGAGEREAIILAEQLKADALLIDDRYAPRAAKRRHLAEALPEAGPPCQ